MKEIYSKPLNRFLKVLWIFFYIFSLVEVISLWWTNSPGTWVFTFFAVIGLFESIKITFHYILIGEWYPK